MVDEAAATGSWFLAPPRGRLVVALQAGVVDCRGRRTVEPFWEPFWELTLPLLPLSPRTTKLLAGEVG